MARARAAPHSSILAALLGLGAGVFATACMQSTPFESDPEVTEKTRLNLEH